MTDAINDDGITGRPSSFAENGTTKGVPSHFLDQRLAERLERLALFDDSPRPSYCTNEATEGGDLDTKFGRDCRGERRLPARDSAAEANDNVHDP
jgi:hypothetical protein